MTIANTTTITSGITLTASTIINGAYDLEVGAGITLSSTFTLSGTATIVLNGTGTWTTAATTNTIANKLTINTSGTITINNGYYITGVLTLTSGTVSGTINLRGGCSLIGVGVTGIALTFAVTGTYTLTGNLTVGALTITTATTFSGAYTISCSTLLFNAAATHTLTGDIDCSGAFTINGFAVGVTGSGKTIYVGGNLTLSASGSISGTADIVLDGTGTWSTSSSACRVSNNLTINTAGTITCGANIYYGSGTLTYTAGTVNVSTFNTVLNIAVSSTLDISGKTWRNMTFSGTMTLLSNITTDSSGTVTISGTTVLTASGGTRTLTVGRYFTVSSGVSGTTGIVLSGNSGNWTGSGTVSNDLTISGNLTISGTVAYSTGTLTRSSGTVTTTGSTLGIKGSCTITSNGLVWNNITFDSGHTVTLGSYISLGSGTLSTVGSSVNPACAFSGSYSILCGSLILEAGGGGLVAITPSLTIPAGQTLTVNTAITSGQALQTSTATISSGTPSSYAYLVYNGTRSNLKCTKTTFTDIDASGGNTIFNYRGGTLTRTVNIVNLNSPATLSVAS
jgi:hypothetical protein